MKDRKIIIKKRKISLIQLVRSAIQLASAVFVPGAFVWLFYCFKDVFSSVFNGSFTFEGQLSNLVRIAALLLITLVWGRFFCGFICSFGFLQDVIRLGGKHLPFQPRISEKTEKYLKKIKFAVLVFVIVGVWALSLPQDSVWSPWTVFGSFGVFAPLPAKETLLSIGGALLLLSMMGSSLIERFFCRYFCPLGAIFSIVSHFRLFGVKKKTSECSSCRLCTTKCAASLPLYKFDKVTSGECINCLKCVSVCPKENAVIETGGAVMGTLAAAAAAGMIYIGPLVTPEEPVIKTEENFKTEEKKTDGEESAKLRDGVYRGSAQGYRGQVSVTVTVKDGRIKDITVDSHNDDANYFRMAKNRIVPEIISSQDTGVATLTGATFSSKGIIDAVKNALGSAPVTEAASPIETDPAPETTHETASETTASTEETAATAEEIKETEEINETNETEEILKTQETKEAEKTGEKETQSLTKTEEITETQEKNETQAAPETKELTEEPAITETQEATQKQTETQEISETEEIKETAEHIDPIETNQTGSLTETEETDEKEETKEQVGTEEQPETKETVEKTVEKTEEKQPVSFADGVYYGSGTGYRGTTNVRVTVSEGEIYDITVISFADNEPFFNMAKSEVIEAILLSQDVNVPTVSGATFSSRSIIEAVADALDIKYADPDFSSSGGRAESH
ncbi:MAG: FMN-binding protein [Clostridia bacterium]|nr:FMN-binding protein [Clostridia bacterium]